MLFLLWVLDTVNVVAADVVEVAPAHDHADVTSLSGATVVYDMLSFMARKMQRVRPIRTILTASEAVQARQSSALECPRRLHLTRVVLSLIVPPQSMGRRWATDHCPTARTCRS
ncbi:arginase family protein [Corynebacterium variabile]|uniref:arginase family protein n=1 Tax=Actinomycetes TaxID=1760 RepID=UPI003F92E58D